MYNLVLLHQLAASYQLLRHPVAQDHLQDSETISEGLRRCPAEKSFYKQVTFSFYKQVFLVSKIDLLELPKETGIRLKLRTSFASP